MAILPSALCLLPSIGRHQLLLRLDRRAGARGVAADGAARAAAALARLDHQAAARRAGRRERAIPEGEVAGGVAIAAVEDPPALARPLDDDLVLAALRAGDAGPLGDVLGALALREAGAGQELAEAAELDHHRPPAEVADLVARLVGDLDPPDRPLGLLHRGGEGAVELP